MLMDRKEEIFFVIKIIVISEPTLRVEIQLLLVQGLFCFINHLANKNRKNDLWNTLCGVFFGGGVYCQNYFVMLFWLFLYGPTLFVCWPYGSMLLSAIFFFLTPVRYLCWCWICMGDVAVRSFRLPVWWLVFRLNIGACLSAWLQMCLDGYLEVLVVYLGIQWSLNKASASRWSGNYPVFKISFLMTWHDCLCLCVSETFIHIIL